MLLVVLVDVDPKDPGTLAGQGSSLPQGIHSPLHSTPHFPTAELGLVRAPPVLQPACGLWIAKTPREGEAVWPATQQEGTRGPSSKTQKDQEHVQTSELVI